MNVVPAMFGGAGNSFTSSLCLVMGPELLSLSSACHLWCLRMFVSKMEPEVDG